MEKIRIAVIGCGYWGRHFVRILGSHPDCILTALCDLDIRRLSGDQNPDLILETDWKRIADHPHIDAVVIATPASTHAEIAKAMVEAGKHVLCEKPLTLSAGSAALLETSAAARQLVFMTGHTFLYHPAVRYLKETLREGNAGKLLYFHSQRSGQGIFREDADVVWDMGPHDVSMMLYLTDQMPLSVVANAVSYSGRGAEVAFIHLQFQEQVMAGIYLSWHEPVKTRKFTVVGEKAMIVFDDVSISEKVRVFEKGEGYHRQATDFGMFQQAVRGGNILIPQLSAAEPLRVECSDFLGRILRNEYASPQPVKGSSVAQVLEAVQQSIQGGGVHVEISPRS